MDIIRQSNRAILFEEINPEKQDLVTTVGEVRDKDSLTDDQVKEIHEKLLCFSYQEFHDKCAPTVDYFFNAANGKVV